MSLVLIRKTAPTEAWLAALRDACPGLDVRVWPDTGPVEDVEFVLTWAADPGVIAGFPNLRAIFSLGAGVDHILKDSTVPAALPVARMVDSSLTMGMVQYVTMAALQYRRGWEAMRASQREGQWRRPELGGARVGILGLGELGGACGKALAALGFEVAGWSRSAKDIAGIRAYTGQDQLAGFLARSDVLVCLLPLTAELENFLNRATFDQLPRGAYLVHAGRGEHLVEADLLDALDRGQLSGAVLDVFRHEPLPGGHPFWAREDIIITPHNASQTHPATAAAHVAANVARARAGQALIGQVDRAQGY
ncbi:2-hydroxyacid dehydrogenase [Achromobacter aloeverae]|uniref:Glyoxylate/hydroxypyruvate reductase A n=1 Tax=Achromobacter aloeverae TaxID=1750518 RepID=A0A4Q1HIR6_9BURK|nr:glyoxylate/hydroxypyruvate reductase A [Achromobacter aloeverae]RXN86891.1 glyoxylate/hydroxypyruvate reductase A [Achromobacter aloeverae]